MAMKGPADGKIIFGRFAPDIRAIAVLLSPCAEYGPVSENSLFHMFNVIQVNCECRSILIFGMQFKKFKSRDVRVKETAGRSEDI